MILAQSIFDQYKDYMNPLRKLGAVTIPNVSQVVCDNEYKRLIKSGFSEIQAQNMVNAGIQRCDAELYHKCWMVYGLAKWNQCGKQVYRFNEELTRVLLGNRSLEIPLQCLDMLPTKAFFVETTKDSEGFYFCKEYDKEIGDYFILLAVSHGEITHFFSIPCKDKQKISDALRATLQSEGEDIPQERFDTTTTYLSGVMQLVLYLAAVNAEVTTTRNKPVSPERIAKAARKSSKEIRKGNQVQPTLYHVGTDFGKRYQQYREKTQTESTNKGTKKRPHIRRSHFHHYWTGSADEKKLTLKWIDTIFVNNNNDEDVLPTIRNVK